MEDAVLGAAKRHLGMVRAKGSGRCWMMSALCEAINRRNWLGRDLVRNGERWLEACREVAALLLRLRQLPGARTWSPWAPLLTCLGCKRWCGP